MSEDIHFLHALILGLVEGLTEFIPVSSTGHLILLVELLGFNGPPGKVFEIVVQLGAILAICWLYKDKLITSTIQARHDAASRRFLLAILIAFLPAALIGATFHHEIKTYLFNPKLVSITLILGGLAILLIEKYVHTPRYNTIESMPWKVVLLIGFAQSLAMVPGVSRSGATIMGAMVAGVDRKTATEFSFFLAIPTMLGATVYDTAKNYAHLSSEHWLTIAIGFVSAFFAALIVVRSLIAFISKHGFAPFAYYRILLGSIMVLMLW